VANCTFCGQDAGWFKAYHDVCKAKDEDRRRKEIADAKQQIIDTLSRGERIPLEGAESFLLQANEELLFVLRGAGYAESKYKQSGAQLGWVFGDIHQGDLGVTTKRLLFAGSRSVSIAISRIVTVSNNTLNTGTATLTGLGIDTGAASRKVFILDDPTFLAQLIDIARAQGSTVARPRNPSAVAPQTPAKSGPQPVATSSTFKITLAKDCPNFSAVGGMADVKLQLRSTLGLVLRERQKAAALGIRFNGVLLYGPPGTGKTLLAKACAGEFGCNLLSIGSADIMSAFVGDSPRLVSAAFETASANAPAILFFDEFDAIAERRGGGGGDAGSAADRQVLEQLLRNLEGIRDRPDVIVMAATNRLDDLDPAVMRPGRFDLKVRVDLPDLDARAAIFEATLRGRKAATIDPHVLADATAGLSAAAISSIVDTAALAALQRSGSRGAATIEMADLTSAIAARGGHDRPLTKHATWDELVLLPSTKSELQKIQVLIQDPGRAKQFGVTPPRGVLLYGPPGTGKTSIARVLASETRASFYPMSCADLVSKWMGESEGNVAQLFARARENRPSIIFLDEIDAIARKRGSDAGNSGLDRVLNQLLQEIDGLEGAEGIFVLAATNRREIVDEALLRGGRLGRQIYIGLPDATGRETLLRLYAHDMPVAPDVDLKAVADSTADWSGADLRQLCEQAAMEAMMSSSDASAAHVTADHFMAALQTTQQQRVTTA
jgi:transitional endoplasmic reticulum ATPase